jgi:uncharacterized protein YukE
LNQYGTRVGTSTENLCGTEEDWRASGFKGGICPAGRQINRLRTDGNEGKFQAEQTACLERLMFGRPTNQRERDIMAQAIMDPEEVRRFAQELKKFNADLQNGMASLQARFAALSDTWQDQEHQKFAEEFKQTMKALKKFIEISNQHSPFLLRKAQRIEEYLNQH